MSWVVKIDYEGGSKAVHVLATFQEVWELIKELPGDQVTLLDVRRAVEEYQ